MTDRGLYSCTFEAKVVGVPELQYEKYVENRAKAMGVRGFIQPVSEDMYVGQLQGTQFGIDFMKDVLEDPTEYYNELQDITFSKLTELKTFSLQSFQIQNNCNDDGFEGSGLCDMAFNILEPSYSRVEQVKEIINLKAKSICDALQQNSEQVAHNMQCAIQPTLDKILELKLQAACFLYQVGLKVTTAISKYCGASGRPQRQGVQTQTVSFQSQAPY